MVTQKAAVQWLIACSNRETRQQSQVCLSRRQTDWLMAAGLESWQFVFITELSNLTSGSAGRGQSARHTHTHTLTHLFLFFHTNGKSRLQSCHCPKTRLKNKVNLPTLTNPRPQAQKLVDSGPHVTQAAAMSKQLSSGHDPIGVKCLGLVPYPTARCDPRGVATSN